jgi:hypothetical protein
MARTQRHGSGCRNQQLAVNIVAMMDDCDPDNLAAAYEELAGDGEESDVEVFFAAQCETLSTDDWQADEERNPCQKSR